MSDGDSIKDDQSAARTEYESEGAEEETVHGDEDQPPIPYRQEDRYPSEDGQYSEEEGDRGPSRRLPPPQPVDLPTPVRSPSQFPHQQFSQQGQPMNMRPPFPGGMPPPGMGEVPRPSLPRIAGVRDPISTT